MEKEQQEMNEGMAMKANQGSQKVELRISGNYGWVEISPIDQEALPELKKTGETFYAVLANVDEIEFYLNDDQDPLEVDPTEQMWEWFDEDGNIQLPANGNFFKENFSKNLDIDNIYNTSVLNGYKDENDMIAVKANYENGLWFATIELAEGEEFDPAKIKVPGFTDDDEAVIPLNCINLNNGIIYDGKWYELEFDNGSGSENEYTVAEKFFDESTIQDVEVEDEEDDDDFWDD